MKKTILNFTFCLAILAVSHVKAQEDTGASAEELAKKLANPVAPLISVPIQNNFDFGVGPLEGFKYSLNVQPVIPVAISDDWNMVSRTIMPIISQNDVTGLGKSETGLGDIAQSFFFVPASSKNGLVWGAGPILLLPTATNDALGLQKWGIGPTALVLKIQGTFTYGMLVNHMWSYAGSGPNDINASFFQPFITYASKSGVSVTFSAENTQSWNNDIFGGFAGIYALKVASIGKQQIQYGGGPKVYYGNNPFNPKWGLRANIVFLFPK